MTNADVQRALIALGYDLGRGGPTGKGDDGIWGALSRKAAEAFQRAKGLKPTGMPDLDTTAQLLPKRVGEAPVPPPWFAELKRRQGLHEVRDRSKLMAWLRSDGKTLGDPAKLPWCGDAVQTCLALTLPDEPQPANPYLARNWLKLGVPLATPALGAILVFYRGPLDGTSGHVGLYVGEDANAFHVLGGNQSNAITIARLDKARLLGVRWPSTYPLPHTGRVRLTAAGALSRDEA